MIFNDTPVVAVGLDFDGCVYNNDYIEKAQPKSDYVENPECPIAIKTNPQLFQNIQLQVEKFSQRLPHFYDATVSNRGDFFHDKHNSDASPSPSEPAFPGHSSFKTLGVISKYSREKLLRGKFATFNTIKALPADAYNNKPEGSCFNQAMELLNLLQEKPSGEENDTLADAKERARFKGDEATIRRVPIIRNLVYSKTISYTVFDHSKISTLYFYAHLLRKTHPNSPIEFHFYDDRADIFEKLKNFYGKNPDLLPMGFKVHFHKYNGGKIIDLGSITGTGRPDHHYPNSMREMARLCNAGQMPQFGDKAIDFAEKLPIDQFKVYRLQQELTGLYRNTITDPYHRLIDNRIIELQKEIAAFFHWNKELKYKKLIAVYELKIILLKTQNEVSGPHVPQAQINKWLTENIKIIKRNHPTMEEGGIINPSDTSQLLINLEGVSKRGLPRPNFQ